MADFSRESMMDMFIYEMNQLLEQLEQNVISSESEYTMDDINEIFRIMHTIKGSAAMMLFDSISKAAHSIEDLFYYLREENPVGIDNSLLTDYVLEGMDFIKVEMGKVEATGTCDGDPTDTFNKITGYLKQIKEGSSSSKTKGQSGSADNAGGTSAKPIAPVHKVDVSNMPRYKSSIYFQEDCEMENVRVFTLLHNLKDSIFDVVQQPEDVIAEESENIIRMNGFHFEFNSPKSYDELYAALEEVLYVRDIELAIIDSSGAAVAVAPTSQTLSTFEAFVSFEDGCEMENVRAYTIVHNLKPLCTDISHIPEDIIDEGAIPVIRKNGFRMTLTTAKSYDEIYKHLFQTVFLKDLTVTAVSSERIAAEQTIPTAEEGVIQMDTVLAPQVIAEPEITNDDVSSSAPANPAAKKAQPAAQHMISVSIGKLDQLLNLMGELVIAEAMTTQNPDLDGLELENFNKSARQLRKIINDVQDTVMSMRMVPLSNTFFKMHRIVRDMCKQLGKEVRLEIVGEETEVDKNIIEHISDPLMHIVRNSVDHGIEDKAKRKSVGKPESGTVLLEAKNSGGDVLIIIKDDGGGLDKHSIMKKARANGLLRKNESEYTDREIYQFIFLPGFSTNEQVTTFSGRGVGMDVVSTNIEAVGGSVLVESEPGESTTTVLKIPLTLAIIEGMLIRMGEAKYTIPIASIQESFKPRRENIFADPDGNEMITVRGEVYNVIRLYEFFNAQTEITNLEDGIMIMVENEGQTICMFVDELIGEQQVVVKSIPKYIKKIKGISGCTLLGNGDISLIIDVAGFFDK